MLQRVAWIALVLPPVSLLLLCLLGLLLNVRVRRSGRMLVFAGAAGLLVLALPLFSRMVFAALDSGVLTEPSAPGAEPPQAIVILGGDVTHSAAGFGDGPGTLERLRVGAALWRQTKLPVLVSGGATWREEPPVAVLMADSLEKDFNVPVRWVEDRSKDTWENARESAAVLRPEGVSSVYLVTHEWHLRRALFAFKRWGIAARPVAVPVDRGPDEPLYLLLPRPSAWVASYEGLHELVGLLFYSFRDP
jgi:uncharacterized SAM-binding protein YcdF (DUF218 family)